MENDKTGVEIHGDQLCPACKVKFDLNNEFPFAALWQDGVEAGGLMKIVPLISVVINFIMLILVIIILAKK